MKIGIFGGTFDPFTIAHREIVKQALEQKLVDFVFICPTIVTWHRANYVPWLDDNAKLKVIQELLNDIGFEDKFFIDEYDLKLRRLCANDDVLNKRYVTEHRFIDTLMRIKAIETMPDENAELYPIIGSDEYANFGKWHAYGSVLKMSAGIIVAVDEDNVQRDGLECSRLMQKDIAEKAVMLPIRRELRSISASEIRKQFTSYENYIACAKKSIKELESKKLLCHTPIFDVIKNQPLASANGLAPVTVNAPDWVMVAVEKDGKWLVETQLRYGRMQEITEFPCGMVEKSEKAKDAAIRELREETGIHVLDRSTMKYLGSMSPNPAFMANKVTLFYVNLDEAKFMQEDQKLDVHERLAWKFVGKREFEHSIMKDVTADYCFKTYVPAMLLSALKTIEWHKSKGNI